MQPNRDRIEAARNRKPDSFERAKPSRDFIGRGFGGKAGHVETTQPVAE
jgi:hypothetical protein